MSNDSFNFQFLAFHNDTFESDVISKNGMTRNSKNSFGERRQSLIFTAVHDGSKKKYFALPFRPYHVLFENFKEKQGVVN